MAGEPLREKVLEASYFNENAYYIIEEMVELDTPPSTYTTMLVDEILHSIFFLGKLNNPQFSPLNILLNEDIFNGLRDRYPQPFELYSSQLPKRSPFSCVLDMIVHLIGQENEEEIIKKVKEFIQPMKRGRTSKPLVPSTLCVSQSTNTPNSDRYYGVSMSTSGRVAGKIVVAASCLSSWDSYVAGAVMTYYPEKVKKSYFDGTIKLPEQVRLQAFSISKGETMSPCRSCRNLFGLTTSENEWPYGHCAEAESVSNLLKNVTEVREQARPTSTTCTDVNREKAETRVWTTLRGLLKMKKFYWDNNFYTPERVIIKREISEY